MRPIESGSLSFTIESRILRELGERLVKQPEVALVELIKNSYDADATLCEVSYQQGDSITVEDDGAGMTLAEFKSGWMRIGTGSKTNSKETPRFKRHITGEKGIGRFAVRFLGSTLELRSVAYDPKRRFRTVLIATFNWPEFDRTEDLNLVKVPYRLDRAEPGEHLGVLLRIGELRETVDRLNLNSVRTASIAVVTPLASLLKGFNNAPTKRKAGSDPGFSLRITPAETGSDPDLAGAILSRSVIRSVVEFQGDRLSLRVFQRGKKTPVLSINDRYKSDVGDIYADIRFFPQTRGTFTDLPVDGRTAKTWVKSQSGVAVFDRSFRVLPYGTPGDDWLNLASDTASRAREPRSTLAQKHFPMDEPTRVSTQLNYMLRLPYPGQLIGVVQVQSQRSNEELKKSRGLVPAADREGFVNSKALRDLYDIVRGAVEAIAFADRDMQQRAAKILERQRLRTLRAEARAAIKEIQSNKNIPAATRRLIVGQIAAAQSKIEESEARAIETQTRLETMSLLGVVAGFMTHEFGSALDELRRAETLLRNLSKRNGEFAEPKRELTGHIRALEEIVTYSQGYVLGARELPTKAFLVLPRIKQLLRVFGTYAEQRGISVSLDVPADLYAPIVPVSLYAGMALNLFTNALKAVTAVPPSRPKNILFRAWNENASHFLEVSDTGIGIPSAFRSRVFDPLFSTTSENRDPLGSGMGLGLSLVKQAVEHFDGRVVVLDPEPGFTTAVRIRLPLKAD